MTQKIMSVRALGMEELENVNGGARTSNGKLKPISGEAFKKSDWVKAK